MRDADWLAALEKRYGGIQEALDQPPERLTTDARAAIKQGIVDLFHETEHALEQLTELKERIRLLVGRYKALAPVAPAAGLAPAAPTRTDHLGSSTYIERGWSAIAAGDHERAVKELERALELAPDDPKAEGLLGWALMLMERYDEALFTFQKLLAREPSDALARVNLGYICLKKNIFGEAIEHLSRAIRLNNDRKATLYATFYMGLVYLEREMYEDARGFFRKALELGPNLIEAYWELGRAFYLEGELQAAREAWSAGVETNRFNPWGERCEAALRSIQQGLPVAFG